MNFYLLQEYDSLFKQVLIQLQTLASKSLTQENR